MVTPLSWLTRVPTFKEKVRMQPHNVNYGLVGYPVLMAADILIYKAEVVPVGEDQLPHLELTREIVRRFNEHFGDTFAEPQAKLTTFPMVVGLDGKDKMSKSLNNHIELAATAEETMRKVMSAVTDPARKLRSDTGHPEVCNVYKLQQYFNSLRAAGITEECKTAKIGCVECKRLLAEAINVELAPLRARRAELAGHPDLIDRILRDGAHRAQAIAGTTLLEVKQKMGLY
jgi:tryptophanyl-tRNA synthetase